MTILRKYAELIKAFTKFLGNIFFSKQGAISVTATLAATVKAKRLKLMAALAIVP
jgi:hypothetical protein